MSPDFADAYCTLCGTRLKPREAHVHPTSIRGSAKPAPAADAIIRELVAVDDLRAKLEGGGFFYGRDPYSNVMQAREEYFSRLDAAWSAARAFLKERA